MTLTEIRRALTELETHPRQSLGQNFLHDQNLARWTVSLLDLQPGDHVVEIGPGLGSLTQWIIHAGASVTLLEKDSLMVDWLRRSLPSDRVELFHGDALDFDLRHLYGRGPVKVIGNLPYYISTPLIAKFASALSPASILVLTIQHEVAGRLAATPASKEYGAMTVCTSRRWHVRYHRKLPPSVFYPQPKVSSAVISLQKRPPSDIPPCDDILFDSLVRRGFGERRKQLRNLLPEFRDRWPEICANLAIPDTARAEELSLSQWEKFSQLATFAQPQKGSEIFDVVNESDSVIGTERREVVHVNNLRHRAVHMLIFNAQGELLLQKRSLWKDKNPGLWDSSAAGHVDSGETYPAAAAREIREELGIDSPLQSIGRLPCTSRTGWEFIEVFRGRHDGPFHFAPLEVETVAFFPLHQIRAWLARTPSDFSPVFRQVLPLLDDAPQAI